MRSRVAMTGARMGRSLGARRRTVQIACALCGEKRCTSQDFCYGCDRYVCEPCDDAAPGGFHGHASPPSKKKVRVLRVPQGPRK